MEEFDNFDELLDLDDEEFEAKSKGANRKVNDYSDVGIEDRQVLRSKFLKLGSE
jgi:hypothetical protein